MILRRRNFAILLLFLAVFVDGVYAGTTPDKEPPEKCANCHSDSVAFKQWEKSDHANALKTLLKAPDASISCLRCHSADYRGARSDPWMSRSSTPTPETATNAISCSSCHKHDSGFGDNLIMPADKLCATCHVRFCGG